MGLNQTDFGAAGGVKRDAQQNYENGTRRPDSLYLESIVELGVDVMYLLTGQRNASSISPDEADLVRRYREASDAVRAAALGALIGGAAPAKVQQNFHSGVKIGQHVAGDITVPQTIHVGGSKKKK
ncbi:transcriptional regulator [Pandoraea fibrosis]|uniref:Transcriptional regulator n=1 Tax=Pandoraea fibrosis TaxID=1891094 RepID=A0A5E4SQY8_9BURK|nr:transcriptional regulator [Pandoraea fibrosis]